MPSHVMNHSDNSLIFNNISRGNNMNVVRYYLSICVVISHVTVLTGVWFPSLQSINMVVGCFFALSGFLMFPSFQRHTGLRGYFARRVRKIMPSYVFIVVLAAVSLVAVSELPAGEYFSSPGLYKYLGANLSFLNFLCPDLPGVFKGGEFATDAVNGSLWTMKGELACCLSVPVVYWLARKAGKRRAGALMLGIVVLCIVSRLLLLEFGPGGERSLNAIIAKQFGTVFVFFYVGALINIYWTKFLRYKWYILAADVAVILLCDYIPFYYTVLQPFVGASMVLWFSLVGKWGTRLSRHDDVSYDIYLFHFPIIQLAVYFGLPGRINGLAMLLLIISVTVALALFSWNVVGKRFQRRA